MTLLLTLNKESVTYFYDISNVQVTTSQDRVSEEVHPLSELYVGYDVYKLLMKLDSRKGAGSDGLSNLFPKNCAIGPAETITYLFCASLYLGQFSSAGKT